MQPDQTPSLTTNPQPGYATVLATIAAVFAILALPFALIPFLGLAGSTLILGFISALAIWTRRKRAIIGSGIAFLAVIIAAVSSFICIHAIVESRNAAVAKMAEVQSQLQAMKSETENNSQKSALGGLIKQLGGKDITEDQANMLGKVGEWIISAATSDDNANSDQNQK